MDPIFVPAPPRSAYNENRRVSDLLYHQLRHFQHIERKRKDLGITDAVARDIHTEAGAARYIAAVTSALRNVAVAQPVGSAAMVTAASAPPIAATSVAPPLPVKTPVPAKKAYAGKADAKRRAAKKSKVRK